MKTFDPLRFVRRSTDNDSARKLMIAEAAYYRAQRRGFVPGYEVVDWLDAEREVDAKMAELASLRYAPSLNRRG